MQRVQEKKGSRASRLMSCLLDPAACCGGKPCLQSGKGLDTSDCFSPPLTLQQLPTKTLHLDFLYVEELMLILVFQLMQSQAHPVLQLTKGRRVVVLHPSMTRPVCSQGLCSGNIGVRRHPEAGNGI